MGKFCAGLAKIAGCCLSSKGKVDDAEEPITDPCNLGGAPAGNPNLDHGPLSPQPQLSSSSSSNSSSSTTTSESSSTSNSPNNENNINNNINNHRDAPVMEWTSGARKETITINWKVQNFPALCELKELLRNEPCVFSLGSSINTSTRWCFNLQKMKNENNIGLFLKRLKPLTFNEVLSPSSAIINIDDTSTTDVNNNSGNEIIAAALQLANSRGNVPPPPGLQLQSNATVKDDPVYVYYECIIQRSGFGEVWLHKRTCIPTFEVGQRLGFRKLFTLDDMNDADQQQQKTKVPLLSQDNTLNLEIKFTIHLKTDGRTKSEMDLLQALSLEKSERYHCHLLREQLISLLKTGQNSDLIIIMESDDRTFPVHRAILSARSPVFAAMIQSGMKESRSGIVRIKDVSSKAMENILSYVYSGVPDVELRWGNVREVQELIYAADKYSLQGLRDLCDKMMFTGCDKDNATELLYLAQQHGLNIAVKEISMYIKRNVNEIFNGKT